MPTCPTCARVVADGLERCPHDGTRLTATPAWIGRTLGDRYRIQSVLGEGGMGTVYLAEHVVLGKPFAVKVLREEYSRDEDLVRRFQQEAIAASQIGQENIVDITDFGRTPEGALYFVMERLNGRSLLKTVQHFGPLRVSRALPILVQICRALAAAHSRGIVHRDLKPENIILVPREDGSDQVKVLDFGISRVGTPTEGERITRVGVVLGTPEYMAPEQVEGGPMDHRVDIYALGILAYEVLTGTVPFHGSSPMAVLLKHQKDPPEPLTQRKKDLVLPPGLEMLLLSMLEKDPAKRPQTMLQIANALAELDGGTPATLRPAPLALVPAPQPPSGPGTRPGPQLGTQELAAIQRRRPGAWLGVLAAVLVLGVGGVLMWRASGPTADPAPAPAPAPAPMPAENPAPPPEALAVTPLSVPAAAEKLSVSLSSRPAGAAVWSGDERLGVTPLVVELARGATAEYRFTLDGHRPVQRVVAAEAGALEVTLPKQPGRARPADEDAVFRKIDDLKENPFQ